ncbi:hypothetical protein DSLASN_46300 [Desulfoluna limicola]|uniref:Uncharacterized protein n=1 Tax=Desulfoluna limicola TaxID=2810562 RepID=A0ABN6FD07_9BACT|nr:hypothetical protein [Desulfoluna limicola]BCS98998.1 hypothetical protein DSLASN_46300 [Desulfoluna limicola]
MIDYLILPQYQLILNWNRGDTSINECMEYTRKIQQDPDHSPDFDVITDVTQLQRAYTSQEIWQMVHHSKSYRPGTRPKKNAIIAPSNRTYGTSRMYEQLANGFSPYETAVFRDWTSALEWLGKDPAVIFKCLKEKQTPDKHPF